MARQDASHLFGAEHVRAYRETDGELGHDWKRGSPVLLLTTTGRRSGEERTTPLIYGRSGDDYLIVASHGGCARAARLVPEPDRAARGRGPGARRPLPRPRAHRHAGGEAGDVAGDGGHWPAYDEYQQRTEREIPVVVLERV